MQTKILLGLGLTLFILVFVPIYWAMEGERQEVALERQMTEAAERGAHLYVLHCASCHGSSGEGRAGAALKNSPLDADVLSKVISRGIAGTAMPAFGAEDGGPLGHHEIADLITLIKSWDDALLPPPEELPETTSSQLLGDDLFAEKCAACHGADREGIQGFAPPLTAKSLAGLSDEQVIEAIRSGIPGSAMPPFGGALTAEEMEGLLQFTKYGP